MTNQQPEKHLLDKAALIFKNAKLGAKLTLSPQQQHTFINVLNECDRMARARKNFSIRFKKFWDEKGHQSKCNEMVTFFVEDWLTFCKTAWDELEDNTNENPS